jgi:hypothetical protein
MDFLKDHADYLALHMYVGNANNNFGELPPSSFSGKVFDDRNNDGLFNGPDAGIPTVTVGEKIADLTPSQSIDMLKGERHRLENLGAGPIEVI